MDEGGRNVTPDKLPRDYTQKLDRACDLHLEKCLLALRPRIAIGVGGYAEKCLSRVCINNAELASTQITKILHPSPASPAANRNWAPLVREQLVNAGVLA